MSNIRGTEACVVRIFLSRREVREGYPEAVGIDTFDVGGSVVDEIEAPSDKRVAKRVLCVCVGFTSDGDTKTRRMRKRE